MELKSIFHRCIECNEIITNPLCAECLAERMKIMIGEYNPQLAKEISGFSGEGETKCLFCGNRMGLCAHCFSKDIYEFLVEKNPELAEEFIAQFDFDLRKELV